MHCLLQSYTSTLCTYAAHDSDPRLHMMAADVCPLQVHVCHTCPGQPFWGTEVASSSVVSGAECRRMKERCDGLRSALPKYNCHLSFLLCCSSVVTKAAPLRPVFQSNASGAWQAAAAFKSQGSGDQGRTLDVAREVSGWAQRGGCAAAGHAPGLHWLLL